MPMIEDAIALAAQAHRGQKDKGGAPYILHPLRLMLRMTTDAERMVAVLHDVVEDTEWTEEALRKKGYPETVLGPLRALTKRQGESYEEFIDRAALDPVARRVKLADLEDNMDLRRIPQPTTGDLDRLVRYRRAWSLLTKAPSSG
jgi:(p)ppGpp synthase/HD superfamily hydrolase